MDNKNIKKVKFVRGIGINDMKGVSHIKGKAILQYEVWQNMLKRCTNECYQTDFPTYKGVKVCDEWKLFSNFYNWFNANYKWDLVEQGIKIVLDKDILVKDNKIYSPETCIFIPEKVNLYIRNKTSRNTSGYTGVVWDKRYCKWVVGTTSFKTGKYIYLDSFSDIEEASREYIKERGRQLIDIKEYLISLGYDKDIVNNIKEI